jgi:hypothetical protein
MKKWNWKPLREVRLSGLFRQLMQVSHTDPEVIFSIRRLLGSRDQPLRFVMLGADAMEVDKPAPVWRTALRLVTERFASMELFKDAVQTAKEVKLIK